MWLYCKYLIIKIFSTQYGYYKYPYKRYRKLNPTRKNVFNIVASCATMPKKKNIMGVYQDYWSKSVNFCDATPSAPTLRRTSSHNPLPLTIVALHWWLWQNCWGAITVLEITVGHWSFSDQIQYLTKQNLFYSDKFTVCFQWEAINIPLKSSNLPKMSNQFLNLVSGIAIKWYLQASNRKYTIQQLANK